MVQQNKNRIIEELIDLIFEQRFSAPTEERVKAWFADSDKENEKDNVLFLKYQSINLSPDQSVKKSYSQVCATIGLKNEIKKRKTVNVLFKIAAILAIPVIVFGVLHLIKVKKATPQTSEILWSQIHVPKGEQEHVVLPDGSEVLLNSGSTLRYPKEFIGIKDRFVELDGEGVFEVSRDIERPFIVKTEHLSIRVLGTEFNVDAYRDNSNITVLLVSGEVDVETSNKKTIKLKPNQKLRFNPRTHSLTIEEVSDLEAELVWQTGNIFLENMTLHEIFNSIERSYNVTIQFDSVDINDSDTYTLKLSSNDSVNNAFDIIQAIAQDIEIIQLKENVFLVKRKI